jgi:F0F1-type ATP synthase membrane subunit b/b'
MITINATFLLVFISFLIFMGLMKALFFDPVQQVKANREHKLTEDAQTAAKSRMERETLSAAYQEELQKARKHATDLISQARQQAKQQAMEKTGSAREEARILLEAKMIELADWREQTYHSLSAERDAIVELIYHKLTHDGTQPISPACPSGNLG